MAENAIGITELQNREHLGPNKTGDNIEAKRVANYSWNGTDWERNPVPFLTKPFDKIVINYTDATKTVISTVVSYVGATVQETLTYTSATTSDTYVRS